MEYKENRSDTFFFQDHWLRNLVQPKCPVSNVTGYLKGKSAISVIRRFKRMQRILIIIPLRLNAIIISRYTNTYLKKKILDMA